MERLLIFMDPSRTFHDRDLIISSQILFPYFNFLDCGDLHSSDHFPLIISFLNFYNTNHKIPKYIYDKADWTTFTLNTVITSTMTKGDINIAVALIIKSIITAADVSVPKFSGHPGKHSRPWWNVDCQLAKKKQKKLGIFRRYSTKQIT